MAAGEAPKNIRASLYIDGKPAENSIKGVGQVAQSLRKDLNNLTIGTAEFNAKAAELKNVSAYLAEARQQATNLHGAMGDIKESFTGLFEGLGIGVGISELVSFGKELTDIEVRASGVEQAFAKIGDTEGYIEKLRASSRGMISDLDLKKMAVQANEFNVPMSKLPLLLSFAAERARATGQNVDELAEKLVEGMGKKGSRSLNALGISSQELNDELKKTPDRIEAIANIIVRRMGDAGVAIDNFGDKMQKRITAWANLKEGAAKLWGNTVQLFFGGTPDTDQEDVAKATSGELKKFKALETLKDKDLDEAIKTQKERVAKLAKSNKSGYQAIVDEQAAQNALDALNNRKANLAQGQEETGTPGTIEFLEKQISDLKKTQKEVSATSDEWKKYQTQIDALQKQADAITGKKEKEDPDAKRAEEKRKAALAEFKRLAIEQKQFEAAELADSRAKNEKEIEQLQNKYDVFIQKEKDFLTKEGATRKQLAATRANIDKLEGEKTTAVNNLKDKQQKELADKISKYLEQLTGKTETELQKQLNANKAFFDALRKEQAPTDAGDITIDLAQAKADDDARIAEHKRLLEEAKKLNEQYGEVSGEDKHSDKVARINTEAEQELAALKKSYSAQAQATQAYADAVMAIMNIKGAKLKNLDREYNKQFIDAGLNAVEDVANAAFQITSANRNAALTAQEKQLETERSNELANTNLTESQKSAINQRYDQQAAVLKKQAWEADKEAQLEQAIINGAVAIAKTFAEYGFTPFGWVAAAGQAEATVTQIAVIESQPTPAFAAGSYTDRDPAGYVGNATIFRNSASGRPFKAGEAGKEWIAPNWMVQSPRYANIIGMLENERQQKRSYAAGGFNGQSLAQPQYPSFDTSGLEAKLDRLHDAIQDQQITLNYQYFQRETARAAQIKTNANAA